MASAQRDLIYGRIARFFTSFMVLAITHWQVGEGIMLRDMWHMTDVEFGWFESELAGFIDWRYHTLPNPISINSTVKGRRLAQNIPIWYFRK